MALAGLSLGAWASPAADVSLQHEFGGQNPWSLDLWWPLGAPGSSRFYTDTAGGFSTNEGNANVQFGLVHRQQVRQWAWGQYTYLQYNNSPNAQPFVTLNPGLEWLNPRWHSNWNLYLPLSATRRSLANPVWASSVGIDSSVVFAPHAMLDQPVQDSDVTGPGTDWVVRYRLWPSQAAAVAVGPYYFRLIDPPMNTSPNVVGVYTALTAPHWRRLSGRLAFRYDNQNHGTVVASMSINLGPPETTSVPDWFNQPVQHNLAGAGEANTLPIVTGFVPVGGLGVVQDNIWFFSPNTENPVTTPSSLADCTYANPCQGLDSQTTATVATLAKDEGFQDNPSLFLKPGTYTLPAGQALRLYGNESLVGRSADYKAAATGSSRALLLVPEIDIASDNGNTHNALSNLQLENTGALAPFAIVAAGTQSLTIDNVMLGAALGNTPESAHYLSGLFADNIQQLTIRNSTFLNDDTLVPSADDTTVENIELWSGIGTLTLANDNFTATAQGSNNLGAINVLSYSNATVINVNNSTLTANGTNSFFEGGTANIQNAGDASNTVNVSNSTLNLTNTNTEAQGINVMLGNASVLTIDQSVLSGRLNTTGRNEGLNNIVLFNNAEATVNNSVLSAESVTAGINTAPTNITLNDSSQLMLNGSQLTSEGLASNVTGSTNITIADTASAWIQNSALFTAFAGAPASEGQEPSGAVSIWALDQGQVTVDNSTVTATSNNDQTGAVALELQGTARGTVTGSTLTSNQQQGNLQTGVADTTVVAAGDSQLSVQNTHIQANQAGSSNQDLAGVIAADNAAINLSNSQVSVNNEATLTNPDLLTAGIAAYNHSRVTLNQVGLSIQGQNPTPTHAEQGGHIIGS